MEDSSLPLHFSFWLKDITKGSSSDQSAQEEVMAGFGLEGGSDSWGGHELSWALPHISSMTPKALTRFHSPSSSAAGEEQPLSLEEGWEAALISVGKALWNASQNTICCLTH